MTVQHQQLATETVQKIHPEVNMEKWAFWKPSKSPDKTLKLQIIERTVRLADGSTLTSKVQVGFTERGSLTTEDRKIYYALIKIWEEQGRPDGLVPLSLRRLAAELNKKWGSNVIAALTESLLRLRLTPFTWENSYYNAHSKETEHLLTAFTTLSELKIIQRKRDGHVTREGGHFRFNEHILRNLLHHHTKPFYLSTLLKLKTEIAQLLYAYVDLIMADKMHYERCSAGLFQELGLKAKAYRKPSNRKQKLLKALRELQGVRLSSGILNDVRLVRTKDQKDYKVVFRKCPETKEPTPYPSQERNCAGSLQSSLSLKGGGGGLVKDNHTPPSHKMARDLVVGFHQALQCPNHQPTDRELDQAAALIVSHGVDAARAIVNFALAEAKKTGFQMCTFGAITQYVTQAVQHIATRQKTRKLTQQQLQQSVAKVLAEEAQECVELDAYYTSLSEAAQATITGHIEGKLKQANLSDPSSLFYAKMRATITYQLLRKWRQRQAAS